MHHASPGQPGLPITLYHAVLEEALAGGDTIVHQVQSVVEGKDQHQADGEQLAGVLHQEGA